MEYKGHEVPHDICRERLLSVLAENSCLLTEKEREEATNPVFCNNIVSCSACIFSLERRTDCRDTIIQFGVDEGYISKGDALQFILDQGE